MEAKSLNKKIMSGRILSTLALIFLLMDAIMKLTEAEDAVKGTVELGFTESTVFILGVILLLCTIFYIIPRTSIIGAILLTGYLGGAVATHFRLENPLFSHILFPIYLGIMIWCGLILRNNNLRKLFFNQIRS